MDLMDTEQEVSKMPPQGMMALLLALVKRFGLDSIQTTNGIYAINQQSSSWELRVPSEEMDDASAFVTDLLIQIEDEYRENYAVLVLPKAA